MRPDPFKTSYGVTIDAEDRIRKVKEFTLDQCEAALEQKRSYQKTVLQAIERRQKKLRSEQPASAAIAERPAVAPFRVPTKRYTANRPHSRAVSQLIEQFGARLVLEAVADYCSQNLMLKVFESPFRSNARLLKGGAR